jgi:predicted N-acyltransferase
VKGHSLGEFIFDQGWAEAAYEAGIPYYPKLLMAVPFTPASGRRILVQPGLSGPISGQVHKTVGLFLRQLCGQGRLSSVHVNFCTDEEVRGLTDAGYLYRKSMQYHWRNEDRLNGGTKYDTFGDYLRNFASKRRIKIKRERRSVEEAGVVVRVYRGEEITDSMLEDMFHMYKTTIDKMEWGRLYLNKEFFQLLGGGFRKNLCFIFAEKVQ